MLLLLATGLALWMVYGVLEADLVIIAANAISLAMLSAMLFFRLRRRGRDAGRKTAAAGSDEALKRSEDRYRTVVENAPPGTLRRDRTP